MICLPPYFQYKKWTSARVRLGLVRMSTTGISPAVKSMELMEIAMSHHSTVLAVWACTFSGLNQGLIDAGLCQQFREGRWFSPDT